MRSNTAILQKFHEPCQEKKSRYDQNTRILIRQTKIATEKESRQIKPEYDRTGQFVFIPACRKKYEKPLFMLKKILIAFAKVDANMGLRSGGVTPIVNLR